MKYTPHCLAICGCGLLLIIAGTIWSQSLGNRMAWTEEQAVKFNEVSANFHQAAHAHGAMHHGHDHGHADEHVSSAQLAAAKAAWQAQMKERDDAIAWRDFWRKALYGSGMAAIILGGAGYLIVKNVLEDD